MKKSTLSIQRCPAVSTLQKILGGKWKIEILYYIAFEDVHRFGELRRHIGDITESSLTKLHACPGIYETVGRSKSQ